MWINQFPFNSQAGIRFAFGFKNVRSVCRLAYQVDRFLQAIVIGGCSVDIAIEVDTETIRTVSGYPIVGTVTPIMSPSRTIDARRSSSQPSVPAGRRGSTIQR